MIIGAHTVLYSRNPDADRRFLRNVLKLPCVDAGGGWLIFGLPPSEVAVHPSERNDRHELYLMCDDVADFVAKMRKRKVACSPVEKTGWGLLVRVILPGGGRLGIYQPRHARPRPLPSGKPGRGKASSRKPDRAASRKSSGISAARRRE
jgi:hypothetical protein